MILLTLVLKKLHKERLAVPNWVVFFITGPFVKRNNAEFTNVNAFFVQYMLYTVLQDTSYCFSSLCLLISPESLLGVSCLGSLGAGCVSVHLNSSELNLLGFWTSDIWDFAISCRKFLHFVFCLCVVFQLLVHYCENGLIDVMILA
jgi:hypothetical protein